MKKLLYIGSSWASRSFDRPYELQPKPTEVPGVDYTNLAHELGITVTDLSQFSISNLSCWNIVYNYPKEYDAIIWVYCEPIKDLGYENYSSLEEFLTSNNFWELRSHINRMILKKLSDLGCPIALIGGSSDVENADYPNLTVIHPSWQKFLANKANVKLSHGWSADVAHHDMTRFPKLKPSAGLVDLMSETFDAWKEMEKSKIFSRTHPTTKGTKLFAAHIKTSLNNWLDTL